ncbi:DDHD domain-containing protein [Xylariaceae sp. FL1272]|nr:DDHD domain-containing protein [Xylariaceae sp. FL1272]
MSSNTIPYQFPAAPKPHNFGPQCRLAPVENPFAAEPSAQTGDSIPPVAAQYFYVSAVPIDDPLSVTVIATSTDPKSSRQALQPFSPADNNALEKAWFGLADAQYRRNHDHARRRRSPSPGLAKANAEKLVAISHDLAVKHAEKHAREGPVREPALAAEQGLPTPDANANLCCPELLIDVGLALRNSFCAVARRKQRLLDRETVAQAVADEMKTMRTDSFANVTEQRGRSGTVGSFTRRRNSVATDTAFNPGIRISVHEDSELRDSQNSKPDSQTESSALDLKLNTTIPTKTAHADAGISGKPFIRVGTPEMFSPPSSLPKTTIRPSTPKQPEEKKEPMRPNRELRPPPDPKEKAMKHSVDVSVGVSRLHEVTLPALQMKPIYWSPVNDIATVLRATWFYRDDMRPVDPTVANQLEAGYRELKPHTETWNDELRCAVEVGPLGEEKVSHALWPKIVDPSSKKNAESAEPALSSDPFCAGRCFQGEAAAEGSLIPIANEDTSSPLQTHRKFDQYHVIYKDEKHAFLLKPSLKPSAYYGRRPVAKIVKGMTIGIPVVRGFDYEVWKKRHQKTKTQQQNVPQQQTASSETQGRRVDEMCKACKAETDRNQVTDLVLVVHGIGQKLAERVENYHFTHAINAFRRAINIELRNDAVKAILRDGQNGIMVLPINWRQNLSFEDGGPMKEEDKAEYAVENFSLKDIEPKTIPAVRSMISDVMFDIPFYMSQHKPQMVAALVNEANRVYRLWCRNNPGFSEKGRVHLIGHSLGSVMSIEVLSRQPTMVPTLQLAKQPQIQFFEFDTKNLFLLGSPAAFFLLLERGALVPRRGRKKPGADAVDVVSDTVVGDAGKFGCLAVDNIYNIMAREDPVAYLLNGTVDPMYAASLKTAYVPSATQSFFQSMGTVMRGFVPGLSAASTDAYSGANIAKPPTVRLPSQLELEVHDFTREEVAEKKAFLLNDNGQIDFFLRSGSGPLELQYLNMLSAHTSYWVNSDLIRLLCLEIGRRPGKANTLPAMRAVKGKRMSVVK